MRDWKSKLCFLGLILTGHIFAQDEIPMTPMSDEALKILEGQPKVEHSKKGKVDLAQLEYVEGFLNYMRNKSDPDDVFGILTVKGKAAKSLMGDMEKAKKVEDKNSKRIILKVSGRNIYCVEYAPESPEAQFLKETHVCEIRITDRRNGIVGESLPLE